MIIICISSSESKKKLKMIQLRTNSMQCIIAFVSALLVCYIHHAEGQGSLIFNQFPCSNAAGNYTSSSQYGTNINLLLSSLVSNGSQNGFFNTSIGSNSDTVYGLVQCRGDLSMENCRTCLNAASVEITQRCPNRKDATLQYDQCLLRYSNSSFFSRVDSDPRAEYNTANASDAGLFNQQLANLMKNLSNTATSSLSRYASGSTNITAFSYIYGVVQCTRDLSPTGCFSCLRSMITEIPSCCNGSIGAKVFSRTCFLRYESSPFVLISEESPPPQVEVSPPPIQTSTPQSTENENGKSTKVVAIVVPVVASVFLIAFCACFAHRRMLKKNKEKRPKIIYERDEIESSESLQFDLDVIRTATDNFSDSNKVGEGGFGTVYKGELFDGQEIAVKRLSKHSEQGLQEFKNEVVLLHKLQHRNLVRLLGFCYGEENLLIYEFVANSSLDKYIFDSMKKSILDWQKRYNIIGGIARGLLYLHEDSRLRIIHRDLKSGNVLLDEELNAKIADFGMAKLFGVDQTQGNTSKIAGTYGYMAPEYALHGFFSVKSDVYSFGILLLEIISGQKTNHFSRSGPLRDLLSYTWKLWKEGNALQLMDPILLESYSAAEVMRCIHIGLLCVQDKLEDRPKMSSVVLMLNSHSFTLGTPSAPAMMLETRTGVDDASGSFSSDESLRYSTNGISSVR